MKSNEERSLGDALWGYGGEEAKFVGAALHEVPPLGGQLQPLLAPQRRLQDLRMRQK